MVPLAAVVLDILSHEEAQVTLAERDDAIDTLLFDRPDEPFSVRVEIRAPPRQPDGLNPAALQDLAEHPGVERIAVVNQIARLPQGIVKLRPWLAE